VGSNLPAGEEVGAFEREGHADTTDVAALRGYSESDLSFTDENGGRLKVGTSSIPGKPAGISRPEFVYIFLAYIVKIEKN
jgi:hypothetical protein